jgi:hypothetical protein
MPWLRRNRFALRRLIGTTLANVRMDARPTVRAVTEIVEQVNSTDA